MKKLLSVVLALYSIGAIWLVPRVGAYSVDQENGEYTVSFSYNTYMGERVLCEEAGCGKALIPSRQTRSLRLNIDADDTIEIGSLLTDLGIVRDEVEKPADLSTTGEYHWRKSSDEPVEVIHKEDFGDDKTIQLEAVFEDVRPSKTSNYIVRVSSQGAQNANGETLPETEDLVWEKSKFNEYVLPEPYHVGWTFKGWNRLDAAGEWGEFDGVIRKSDFVEESDYFAVQAVWDTGEIVGVPGLVDEETGLEIAFETPMPLGSKLAVEGLSANATLREEAPSSLKYIYDISVYADDNEILVEDNEMVISIPLPEDLKGFGYYQVVYIADGETKEYLPATVKDGKLVFNTSHLSIYGIQAANKPFSAEATATEPTISSPETGVKQFGAITNSSASNALTIMGFVAAGVIGGVLLIVKKGHKKI